MNINFAKKSVRSQDAKNLITKLNQRLMEILGHDGTAHICYDEFTGDDGFFLIGYDKEIPVCCAGLHKLDDSTGEIKRVFAVRNNDGFGAKLMAAIEDFAAEIGCRHLVLECRAGNSHALSFYESNGYSTCAKFPPYDTEDDAVCFEKWIS